MNNISIVLIFRFSYHMNMKTKSAQQRWRSISNLSAFVERQMNDKFQVILFSTCLIKWLSWKNACLPIQWLLVRVLNWTWKFIILFFAYDNIVLASDFHIPLNFTSRFPWNLHKLNFFTSFRITSTNFLFSENVPLDVSELKQLPEETIIHNVFELSLHSDYSLVNS